MSESFDHELISAYYDGQLSAADCLRVEQMLQENPACQAYLDDLHLLRADLRALPKLTMRVDLMDQVLRRAERALLEGREDVDLSLSAGVEPHESPAGGADHPRDAATLADGASPESRAAGPLETPLPVSPPTPSTSPHSKAVDATHLSRWDAPLWIALAASICLYLSLAGRDAGTDFEPGADSGPGSVAVFESNVENNVESEVARTDDARDLPSHPTNGLAPSTLPARKSRDPQSDSQDSLAASPAPRGVKLQRQTSGDNRNADFSFHSAPADRRAAGEDEKLRGEPANLSRDSRPLPPGGAIAAEEPATKEAALAGTMKANAEKSNAEREAGPPVAGYFQSQRFQPEGLQAEGAEEKGKTFGQGAADLNAAGGAAGEVAGRRLTKDQGLSKKVTTGPTLGLLQSQIVVCEVEASPDVFFAQFEKVLETESITLAADTERGAAINAPLAATAPPNEQKRDQQGTANPQASGTEVRVYMLQADSAHLTRALSRLERLPEVRLRWSHVDQQFPDRAGLAETPQVLSLPNGSQAVADDLAAASPAAAPPAPPSGPVVAQQELSNQRLSDQQRPAATPKQPAPPAIASDGSHFKSLNGESYGVPSASRQADKLEGDSDSSHAGGEAQLLRLVPAEGESDRSVLPPELRRLGQGMADSQHTLQDLGRSNGPESRVLSTDAAGDSSADLARDGMRGTTAGSGKLAQAVIVVRVRPRPPLLEDPASLNEDEKAR